MKHAVFFTLAALLLARPVYAADEMINPADYICAELIASNVTGQPPIYESLQLDGYASGKSGNVYADATNLATLLIMVSDSCAAKPAEKALKHWQQARKSVPVDTSHKWRADTITCADYNENPDDGSGFVIWLDAWQRGKTGKTASIIKDQATLDHFLEQCKKQPKRLLKDVLAENAR